MAGGRVVGAGKTVVLSVKTSGIDDGEAAEIQVFKSSDHSSLDTLSSKVKNKLISAEWVAKGPDPESEEQGWEVYYKAKCKGLETRANKLLVYCDSVEVESVDAEGSALPDACFRVIAGEERRERNTGSSGLRKEEHLPPGEVTVEWVEPFELIEWIDEKGPRRKAKVKKVPPARLVWPPKGAHTQWVNMPQDEARPEQGSTLKVKVTLEGGKKGDKVFAKLEPADENSARNDPRPELVGGTTADWCEYSGIEAELADDDGKPDCEAVLEVELGKAGGDVFTLSVGGSKEKWSETLTITSWRRLFWQATRSADSALPEPSTLETSLREAFIEYERYADETVAEGDLPAGSFLPAEDLGRGAGKLLVVGDHNKDPLLAKHRNEHAPIDAHVIICDAQYDGGESGSPHEQTIEVEATFARKTVMIDEPDLYDVFATSIQDGQPSLQAGSAWESKAPGGHPDSGKQGELTADMLVWRTGRTPDRVQVVLPAEAAAIVGEGTVPPGAQATDAQVKHPVKLTLKLRVARGPFLGEADGVHQLVVRLQNDQAMCGVMVHELGHAMRQTCAEVPPGLSEGDHGRHYTEHGHLGHHCGNGLDDATWGGATYADADGGCVMFGGGAAAEGAPNQGKFCARCLPFVKADACDALDASASKQVLRQGVDSAADDGGAGSATGAYRITLRLGDLSALCDDPATEAGRQQRMQMLGLLYEPLGGAHMARKYPSAFAHFRKVLSDPEADEATAQQQLIDLLGKEVLKKVGAADGAASELPAAGELARIRLPGGFMFTTADDSALGHPTPHRQRFSAEQALYSANTRIGAIPIIAKVEVEQDGTWSAAPAGLQVQLQLVMPDALPADNAAAAPALRAETRVRNRGAGTPLGPARYVQVAVPGAAAVVAGDPQVDNCPETHGGKRKVGATGADYFETAERAGFNTLAGAAQFPVAAQSPRALAVVAATNAQGEAGVIFRPSRQGGDRFKLRAFLDPIGPGGPASDGTDPAAVAAETGTLVVWRTFHIGRYIVFDYPSSIPAASRAALGGALGTIDFDVLRPELARCYIDLVVERTGARERHVIGDAEWRRMVTWARSHMPRRPAGVDQDYSINDLFVVSSNTSRGLVNIVDAATYDAAGHGLSPADPGRDYQGLIDAFHERCIEYYSGSASSGIVIIQAPQGDTESADNGADYSTSGVGTSRRGCFLFYGSESYRRGMPYDLNANTLHEIGHCLYLPHQWTDKHDRITIGNTTMAGAPPSGFVDAERVTGAPSAARGDLGAYSWDTAAAGFMQLGNARGTFAAGDTVTGGSSGASAPFTAYVHRGAVSGGVPGEHDYRDYCIMSYQKNVRNHYDYCGRCNLKLRGWDTSVIPLNNNGGWPTGLRAPRRRR